MSEERGTDDIEHSRLESGESDSPLPKRDDEILLDRLKHDPPVKQQAPLGVTIGIIAGVLGIGVILFLLFRNPDVYVSQTPQLGGGSAEHTHIDSSALTNKRFRLTRTLDSLEAIVKADHENTDALLALANTYYDGEYWDRAMMTYEHYLEHAPNNPNARIDYAYTIAQTTGDFKLAVGEIDKALALDPNHVQGLFNAGLLSLRANVDNKKEALTSARSYFSRAKDAAAKQGNTKMSEQIDEILTEMEKVETAPPASP